MHVCVSACKYAHIKISNKTHEMPNWSRAYFPPLAYFQSLFSLAIFLFTFYCFCFCCCFRFGSIVLSLACILWRKFLLLLSLFICFLIVDGARCSLPLSQPLARPSLPSSARHLLHAPTVALPIPLAIRSYLLLFYDYGPPALPDYAWRPTATVWQSIFYNATMRRLQFCV